MTLMGSKALVTGGSRGIGAEIARTLARAGADVVINFRKSEDQAKDVVAEIEQAGRKAAALPCDVADSAQVEKLVDDAHAFLGGLDILIVNAGMASRGNMMRTTEDREWKRVIDVDLNGAFYTTRAALKYMHEEKKGSIVFISSVVTRNLGLRSGPYGVAKAGLSALATIIAKEEVRSQIRVNTIGPGLVHTDMGTKLMAAQGADINKMGKAMPFKRVCTPEDIANLAVFLCSDAGSYITGQTIYIDGGATLGL